MPAIKNDKHASDGPTRPAADESAEESADRDLIARWQQGERQAGEMLVRRYYVQIERFFLNKVGARHVADLVQETFAACVAGIDRLQNHSRFRSYLFAVAYNKFCVHLRRRYRVDDRTDLDRVSIRDMSRSPTSALAKRRELRLLLEALRAIPVRYQVTLELHYWEQLKTADIAEVLEIPVGTVRSRLRRARHALEAAISRLALSPHELASTMTNLDQWAEQCRSEIASHSALQSP